jgi:hypothetical protein
MTKQLEKQLYKRFKFLKSFTSAGNFKRIRNGYFPMSCGDGWYNIIYNLFEHIELELNKLPGAQRKAFIISDVKEKWGGLRIYAWGGTDFIDELITVVESLSEQTCETCGKQGKKLCKNGWYYTACPVCAGTLKNV